MLLALDVGNTNITIGVFRRKEIIESFRITTKIQRTSDEYGMIISDLLQAKGKDCKEVKAAIICSVVPNIMHSLVNGIVKYFNIKPIIVGPGVKTGINLSRMNPGEVGADKIVNLVAGYELFGGPALVIDYGTATTYDVVTDDGTFLAGVIVPGIRTSANALVQGAARLPEIEIVKRVIHDTPVLLLDDVLSELDKHRQNYLLDSINNIQTIITCTGLDEFVNHRFSINKIFHIKNGHAVNAN